MAISKIKTQICFCYLYIFGKKTPKHICFWEKILKNRGDINLPHRIALIFLKKSGWSTLIALAIILCPYSYLGPESVSTLCAKWSVLVSSGCSNRTPQIKFFVHWVDIRRNYYWQ